MEHVNNDMDDLFRKAGELYPLKTSESDWDSVLGKLQEEITGESGSFSDLQMNRNRNKRRWLFLLFLIPLGLFSLVYISKTGNKMDTGLRQDAVKNNQTRDHLPTIKNPKEEITTAPASADKKKVINEETDNKTDLVKASENKGADHSGKTRPGSLNIHSSTMGTNDRKQTGTNAKTGVLSAGFSASANRLNSSGSKKASNAADQQTLKEPMAKSLALSIISLNENPSVYGMPFPPLHTTGTTLNTNTVSASPKQNSNNPVSSKGIYAVLIGGPDLSTVAYQSTTQAGYSLGVLLGYHFNKRIAVETGLLWDKKYYYSTGDHFDKNAANFPSSWNVLYLNGNCNMFEIPLNFRYNFATGVNHGFFAEAGLSSYLMKKEYYDYSFTNNGSRPYSRDSTYNKSSNYIFSVIQISAGYEQKIGRNTSIRIEPYLKIPIQGIGIGNMPITSAGLYLGISHNFR